MDFKESKFMKFSQFQVWIWFEKNFHIFLIHKKCTNNLWHKEVYFWRAEIKVIMQGKLFKMCTHLVYCSVLSLGGNANTRRTSKPDQWHILVKGNYYENYQNYQNLMPLTSSDTKRTLMHLFLFTNFAQRELVSKCTQSIRNCT